MKRIAFLTLPVIVCLCIASCGSSGKSLGGTDAYDPLDVPGGTLGVENRDPFGPSFTPGTFLQTTSPQTSFFRSIPREGAQPSKLLANYTDVKVISTSGTYAKVEVVNTGEVGYIPTVMLGTKRSSGQSPVPHAPTLVPGTPQTDPIVPDLAPEPKSKGIQPPEIIDPSRPAE